MKLTHEQQTLIAQKVLRSFGVHASVSASFRKGSKKHRLFYSERISRNFPAVLYWLENNPEWEAEAREFEKQTGALVFHATLTHADFGDCLDFIYVPADSEEVEEFLSYASSGYFRSRCHNLSDDFVESGMIRVVPAMGGLCRIG